MTLPTAGNSLVSDGYVGWAGHVPSFFSAAAPYASTDAYVNFMTEDETGRVSAA